MRILDFWFTKALVILGSEAGSCFSDSCDSLRVSSPSYLAESKVWQKAKFVIPPLANEKVNEWRNVWHVGIGYSEQKKLVYFRVDGVKLDFVKL